VKIIFSRKGFDSQYGGVPSPILPDGNLISFPIPSQFGRPLHDLSFRGKPLTQIASDLKGGAAGSVHLDPDLDTDCVPRQPGWQPTFGQVGAAQSHLANQGVGAGDVFLFFGWFRLVEQSAGRWRYVRGAPDIHSLFGWLQIGEVVRVSSNAPMSVAAQYPWLADHPHVQYGATIGANNTLYVSSEKLRIGGAIAQVSGGGMFRRWTPSLQLTEPGRTRSKWLLPGWMSPGSDMPAMSLHRAADRWEPAGDHVRLQTVGKGQEFVLNVGQHPAAHNWLRGLIETHDT
jgi:hypothetical protein